MEVKAMARPGYGDEERERSVPIPEAGGPSGHAQPAIAVAGTDAPVRVDDAFYEEVRLAVGRGTPSVLLGTSTRSLERNLGKLMAAQRGERASVTTSPLAAGPSSYSRGDVAGEATRYLAAATQVNLHYARTVRRRIIGESFHALAPVYGADPEVIARWALSALRRRFRRDVALTMLFIAEALLVWLLWSERPWHAWILVFAITLLAAVVGVVTGEKIQIRRTLVTGMRREVFDPAAAPEPGNVRTRLRLAEVADQRGGNLVVFQGSSPFVGSGRLVHQGRLVLEASHGAKLSSGTGREPVEFDSADLHAVIVRALSQMGPPYTRVEERLFVNGLHVQGNPSLFLDPLHAPPSSVETSVLRQAELRPTADARVYVCAEITGGQGQLVTTLFARAVRVGGSLYIEWNFHVLPPLSKLFSNIDQLYDQPAAEQLGKALGWGVLCAIPALLISPFVVAEYGWHRVRTKARHDIQSWKIRRGQAFNYGAERSIWEDAPGIGAQDYSIERDEHMAIMAAQEALLRAVENFLEDHNIDTSEFERQVRVIKYSTPKDYNADNLFDAGIVIGERTMVADVGNVHLPPESAPDAKE